MTINSLELGPAPCDNASGEDAWPGTHHLQLVRKEGSSAPASPSDGVLVAAGSTIVNKLDFVQRSNRQYKYRVFACADAGGCTSYYDETSARSLESIDPDADEDDHDDETTAVEQFKLVGISGESDTTHHVDNSYWDGSDWEAESAPVEFVWDGTGGPSDDCVNNVSAVVKLTPIAGGAKEGLFFRLLDSDMTGCGTGRDDDPGSAEADKDDDAIVFVEVESAPEYYVDDRTDCDDGDALVFPGATEHCDGADEDCDGTVDDEAIDPATWYADDDGDGFGDGVLLACAQPQGSSVTDGDCDDADPDVHPAGVEHCDDIDEDCDGAVDNDPVDPVTFYVDGDLDGFGSESIVACDRPGGAALTAGDCDDSNAAVFPAAPEHCDDTDEDCDGVFDNDPVDPATFYADGDADGFGGEPIPACEQPAGSALAGDDCDDSNASVHPGAPEHCDGVDEDCDTTADNDPVDPATFYVDRDADGFGADSVAACDQPDGTGPTGGDCNSWPISDVPGGRLRPPVPPSSGAGMCPASSPDRARRIGGRSGTSASYAPEGAPRRSCRTATQEGLLGDRQVGAKCRMDVVLSAVDATLL